MKRFSKNAFQHSEDGAVWRLSWRQEDTFWHCLTCFGLYSFSISRESWCMLWQELYKQWQVDIPSTWFFLREKKSNIRDWKLWFILRGTVTRSPADLVSLAVPLKVTALLPWHFLFFHTQIWASDYPPWLSPLSGTHGLLPPSVQPPGEDHMQGDTWEHSVPTDCSTKRFLQVSRSFWVANDVVGRNTWFILRKQSWRGLWC